MEKAKNSERVSLFRLIRLFAGFFIGATGTVFMINANIDVWNYYRAGVYYGFSVSYNFGPDIWRVYWMGNCFKYDIFWIVHRFNNVLRFCSSY